MICNFIQNVTLNFAMKDIVKRTLLYFWWNLKITYFHTNYTWYTKTERTFSFLWKNSFISFYSRLHFFYLNLLLLFVCKQFCACAFKINCQRPCHNKTILSLKEKNFCPTNRCDVSSNAKSTHMSQRRTKR